MKGPYDDRIFFIFAVYQCQYPVCYRAVAFRKMLVLEETG